IHAAVSATARAHAEFAGVTGRGSRASRSRYPDVGPMWNAAHSVIGPTRNTSSYIHTNRDATLRSVAAAVTFARTSSVRPRGSDASITPTFVSHSGRFAARSMTIQTLRNRPAAWA